MKEWSCMRCCAHVVNLSTSFTAFQSICFTNESRYVSDRGNWMVENTKLSISLDTFEIVSNRGRLPFDKDAYECKLFSMSSKWATWTYFIQSRSTVSGHCPRGPPPRRRSYSNFANASTVNESSQHSRETPSIRIYEGHVVPSPGRSLLNFVLSSPPWKRGWYKSWIVHYLIFISALRAFTIICNILMLPLVLFLDFPIYDMSESHHIREELITCTLKHHASLVFEIALAWYEVIMQVIMKIEKL